MRIETLTFLGFLACIWVGQGCAESEQRSPETEVEADRAEAREDSLELIAAYQRQAQISGSVRATAETRTARAGITDDAADDPAIWINRNDPGNSMILGTNKTGGLAAYNLSGEEIGYYPVGKTNNVDVLYDFDLNGNLVDLAGATNRTTQAIDLFAIDTQTRALKNIADGVLSVDSTLIDDVYGFCFYRSPVSGDPFLFVNGKNGRLHQYKLLPTPQNTVTLELVRGFNFRSQTEGMVADYRNGILYVGEENAGVWRMSAEFDAPDKPVLIPLSGEQNTQISYDVEGLTLYRRDSISYLIVSSQGNFSYAVFTAGGPDNTYLTSFKISDTAYIDGAQETDGLDVVSDSLSPQYPRGLLVVQDGFNYDGDSLRPQNFKLISWADIEASLPRQ